MFSPAIAVHSIGHTWTQQRVGHKDSSVRPQAHFERRGIFAQRHFVTPVEHRERKGRLPRVMERRIQHAKGHERAEMQPDRITLQQPVFHIDRVVTVRHDDALFQLPALE